MFDNLFNRELSTFGEDQRIVNDAFATVMGQYSPQRGGPRGATLRDLFEVRKELRRALRSRMVNNTSGNAYQDPSNLRAAIDGIDGFLNASPIGDDLRGLNALYGNLEAAQDAFELGQQVITRRNIVSEDVPDIQAELRRGAEQRLARANEVPAGQQVLNQIGLTLGDDLSAEVLNAFVDGARFQLYSAARNNRDPARVLANARMEDFRAIVGNDIADAMADNIEALTARDATNLAAQAGAREAPDAARGSQGVSPLQNLADFSIIGQYLRGNATGVAPAFAARRQLGQTQELTTTGPRRAAVRADAMMSPASGTAAELVGRTVPGTSRTRPGAVGGLAAYGGVEGGEPAENMTEGIRSSLQGIPAVLQDAFIAEWQAMNRNR